MSNLIDQKLFCFETKFSFYRHFVSTIKTFTKKNGQKIVLKASQNLFHEIIDIKFFLKLKLKIENFSKMKKKIYFFGFLKENILIFIVPLSNAYL